MWNFISNWFRKRFLGHHVCEEFTQWKVREEDGEQCLMDINSGVVTKIPCSFRWQERVCTLCGRMEQSQLNNFDNMP